MTDHGPTRHGYHGRALRVDVGATTAIAAWQAVDDQAVREYLGGAGLGAYLLLQEPHPSHPLAPEAPLAFVFSPLVGSPLTTSAKFAVICQSPLTHRFSDSLASSGFALAGKRSAGDALIVVGVAPTPSVLVIEDGQARLDPAEDLWGLGIPSTETALKARYEGFQSAVIGPAGEQQACYATVSHDGRHAGRGGSGAVMGSKNLKAIVVRGQQRCTWAHPEGLIEYARDLSQRSFGPATAKYRELGTAANMLVFNRMRTLPTRNFQRGSFEGAQQLAPEQLAVAREHTRNSCAACTIGCEHLYGIQRGDGDDKQQAVRVEYESLFSLGSLCEIRDSQAVLEAVAACDDFGVDTISFGATVAFGMECVERGWVDEPWLRFGHADALATALGHIRRQTELGQWIAAGSRRWAQHLGPKAERIAPQVKGLEIPGYSPQALHSMALGFAVGARGADHNRSGAYEVDYSDQVDRRNVRPEQARLAVETEDRAAIMDSMILCKFLRGTLEDFYAESARMLHLTTGWDVTAGELEATAKRIVDAKKRFNVRAGWTLAEDTLPARMLEESLEDDPRAKLTHEQLHALVKSYYQFRGWSEEGVPS